MVKYTITESNLHIVDSYAVSKHDFKKTFNQIRALHSTSNVWNRSYFSMKKEWATHNACYALHILRSHTKDVDIEYPQKTILTIAYSIVGILVWPFIK